MEASSLQKSGSINNIHNNSEKETIFGLRADLIVCFFLALITLTCYWQIINHDFINYDDDVYVTENHHVQSGVTLKNIVWAFSAEVSGNWHPLTILSHMLDCHWFGLNAGLHHLTSLFFHIANTLLLFFVLRRTTAALWQSAFVAALFALHPLHIESVAWVAERKDVLSTFFFMLTIWCYSRYVERPGIIRYTQSLLFFALGLMAKPMLVTLPFLLLLLDYWPLKRFQFGRISGIRRLILEKTPFLALSAASSIITWIVQQHAGAVAPFTVFPVILRVANALVSYVTYIGKMIWPFELAVLYPHPLSLPWWHVAGAFVLLALISFLVFRTVRERPYFAVGWLWYIGTLVPVIGLVQVGGQAMADRYSYIPLIGLFIAITWASSDLLIQFRRRKFGLSFLAAMLLSILSATTFLQLQSWNNSITLFEHTLLSSSDNYVAHYNLGVALEKKDRNAEAMQHYYEVLRIYPKFAEAHCCLGALYEKQGNLSMALRHLYAALHINPEYAEAHNELGLTLTNQGRIAEAIKHYSEALRLVPEYAGAHNNMGMAMMSQGRVRKAITHLNEALRINPENANAHYNMGIAMSNQGRVEEAVRYYSEALRLNPGDAQAHNNLALSLSNQGHEDEAIMHYSEALKINPKDAIIHNNMGVILIRKGRIESAVSHFREALKIMPSLESARINLERALISSDKQLTEGPLRTKKE